MTPHSLGRRDFLRLGGAGLAVGVSGISSRAQTETTLAPYLADVDGDGLLGAGDIQLMTQALSTNRGFGLVPNMGFDHRADVFGRGAVGQAEIDAVVRAVQSADPVALRINPRPVTVAWHYGWYDQIRRPLLQQTVRYLMGDYLSNDAIVETGFNALKNEFGITVDALSWIPNRITPTILANYRAGYFGASNAETRHVALLYESILALPSVGGRVDFRSPAVDETLAEDFAAMAETMVEARDRYPTRVFLLDGRPVIFVFASHSWGLNPRDGGEFLRMATVVGQAREAFNQVYGELPYLVGEELLPLASTATPSPDRISRASVFDAVYTYHAANLKTSATPFEMNEAYGRLQRLRLERAAQAIRGLRNRFSSERVLMIPSLAGGFAKHGLPIVNTTRSALADHFKLLTRFNDEVYLPTEWPSAVGSAKLPAPIYTLGSWNEEYEGHAVFPAQFNLALKDSEQFGFDFAMAIKEAFGWNHYAERAIDTR